MNNYDSYTRDSDIEIDSILNSDLNIISKTNEDNSVSLNEDTLSTSICTDNINGIEIDNQNENVIPYSKSTKVSFCIYKLKKR